jgi:hypothetical protein
MQNDTIYRAALERCRDSIGVIRECDKILEISTPLPRKPQTDRGALQLSRDLAYLAWDLEMKAKAFIDGERFFAAYIEATREYEQAQRRLAIAA